MKLKKRVVFALVALAGLIGAVLIAGAVGIRWFIVDTPSMGEAAPRGSLVVTSPTDAGRLRVGDVISFHPPTSPNQTYTHRVSAITINGITTKGDVNGGNDGWQLHNRDLIGRAFLIVPIAGWLIKVVPLIASGILLVWAIAEFIPHRSARRGLRLFASSMVFSFALAQIRPLANFEVLGAFPSMTRPHAVDYTVINTGVLPMGFRSSDGTALVLADGQTGLVQATVNPTTNFVNLGAHLVLQPWQLMLLGLVGSIPLIISFVHYLQSKREAAVEQHEK